jgi:hypothetical protein
MKVPDQDPVASQQVRTCIELLGCHGAGCRGMNSEPSVISDHDEKMLLPLYRQGPPIRLDLRGSLCCIRDSVLF